MQIAKEASEVSYCVRRKVGACIVTKEGLLAIGMNGTVPGQENICELPNGKTSPDTIHAEINALAKLTKEGVSPCGAILFVTTAPCLECAKSIAAVGIREVHYRDLQTSIAGLEYLVNAGVRHKRYRD